MATMTAADKDLMAFRELEAMAKKVAQSAMRRVEKDADLACYICRRAGEYCRELSRGGRKVRGPSVLKQFEPRPGEALEPVRAARYVDTHRRIVE